MGRDFDQIMRSRETDSWKRQWHGSIGTVVGGTLTVPIDSWKRQWHGSIGTVVGGTLTVSVTPSTGRELQFITGLSFSSNLANCGVDLLNGTAFLYSMQLTTADKFVDHFEGLKTSEGTALNIKLYNMWGTAFLNVLGYTVK